MVFGHPLGCGFSDHNYKFVPIEVQIENIRENITGVYAGQMRTAVVLETGRIFVWGEWFTGTKQLKPKEITLPVKSGIKKLAIGKMFTLVLNSFGKVYSIGNNTYGELGVSREVKSSFNLHEIPFFKDMNVIDIDAGARHGLVLNSEGKIYSFGDNSEGQCGIEAGRTYTPTEVPIKSIISGSKPERVYCGEAHSVIITSQGDLFAWGDNTAGRLGLRGGMSIYRPRIVEDIMGKHISSIGCGGLFTAILIGPSKFSIISKKNQTENLIPPK
jgi:alpha-tubulin suppressor-like RCC1 family protein